MATYLRHIWLRILVTLHEFTARISLIRVASEWRLLMAMAARRSADYGRLVVRRFGQCTGPRDGVVAGRWTVRVAGSCPSLLRSIWAV